MPAGALSQFARSLSRVDCLAAACLAYVTLAIAFRFIGKQTLRDFMSVQIFVQGNLLGSEIYLSSGDPAANARRVSGWSETKPAEFLTQRGLSPILLGSSGGGQFLLVLPEEFRADIIAYLEEMAQDVLTVSGGKARLIWAITENLGTWKLIRERLDRELTSRAGALPSAPDFQPFSPAEEPGPELPARPILRGDVDNFAYLLKTADSIESHVSLSVLFRQFFAGEVPRLSDGKAETLYAGSDDFAIAGDWPLLIEIAAEMRRLFERFVQENLSSYPGPEGKTLSMAIAIPREDDTLARVFAESGHLLNASKAVTRDGFHLFGRVVDWKQFPEVIAAKELTLRLVRDFGCSTQFIDELRGFYPEIQTGRRRVEKSDRPWRLYRRLAVTLDPQDRRAGSREFQKAKDALAAEIIGKNVGQARLRPTGRVALEWAKLVANN